MRRHGRSDALTLRHATLLFSCWRAGAVAAWGHVLLTGETGGAGVAITIPR